MPINQKLWNIFAGTFHQKECGRLRIFFQSGICSICGNILNVGLWKVFTVDTDEAIRLTIASGEGYGSSVVYFTSFSANPN
jgi:hypothetical protein